MIILDVQDRRPIYEQLKAKITELVLMEVYPPQMQLPSVRSLARELGVNPNTVQKAYQELERDKIIYSVSGKGSFISPDPLVRERRRRETLDRLRAAASQCLKVGVDKEEILQTVMDSLSGGRGEEETK